MTIGEKIKFLRKARHMTQEQLGSLIGVRKATINKYETGIIVNLKTKTVQEISAALGCSPLFLLDSGTDLDDRWEQYIQSLLIEDLGPLSSDEQRLVRLFRASSDEGRSYILQQSEYAQKLF